MPKIALISDIHANYNALEAVVKKLESEKPDHWLCLGDLVGYGPEPKKCLDFVRENNIPTVLGNHDAGVAGLLSVKHFRNPNRRLIEVTKNILNNDEINWLKSLPLVIESENWIAAHSSPNEPEKWKYIDSAFTARTILSNIGQDICFIGHTHKPGLVSDKIGVNTFKKGHKFLINPGSVGQSRDEDYRSSCCIVDTDNWIYTNFRVEYDVEPVLTSLTKLGFTRREASILLKV